MTREEAIKYLIKPIATSTEIGEKKQKEFEAYDMAIEALQTDAVSLECEVEYLPPKDGIHQAKATINKAVSREFNTEACEEIVDKVKALDSAIGNADMLSVVRCKDCRWYDNGQDYSDYSFDGHCECDSLYAQMVGVLNGVAFEPCENFYCRFGERKEP